MDANEATSPYPATRHPQGHYLGHDHGVVQRHGRLGRLGQPVCLAVPRLPCPDGVHLVEVLEAAVVVTTPPHRIAHGPGDAKRRDGRSFRLQRNNVFHTHTNASLPDVLLDAFQPDLGRRLADALNDLLDLSKHNAREPETQQLIVG